MRRDYHDVSRRGKKIDKGGKLAVANLHAVELRLRTCARQLELLDDVGNLLESMRVRECCLCRMGNDQKSGLFEKDHLICPARLGEAEATGAIVRVVRVLLTRLDIMRTKIS